MRRPTPKTYAAGSEQFWGQVIRQEGERGLGMGAPETETKPVKGDDRRMTVGWHH